MSHSSAHLVLFKILTIYGQNYVLWCFVLVLMTVWMLLPGVRAETSTRIAGGPQGFESDGLRGLKALGVRELSYRLAFLACNVAPTNPRVRSARPCV